MSNYCVYGLRDPRTNQIRYVGKTCRPERRFIEHVADARRNVHTYASRWIRGVLIANLKPEMMILESGLSKDEANTREREWIIRGKQDGWRLTNLTVGGDGGGTKGRKRSRAAVEKTANANRGKHRTQEQRQRIGDVQRGKPKPLRTEEHCKHLSEVQKGRVFTEQHKNRLSIARRKRKPPTEETKQKLSDSIRKWWAAKRLQKEN